VSAHANNPAWTAAMAATISGSDIGKGSALNVHPDGSQRAWPAQPAAGRLTSEARRGRRRCPGRGTRRDPPPNSPASLCSDQPPTCEIFFKLSMSFCPFFRAPSVCCVGSGDSTPSMRLAVSDSAARSLKMSVKSVNPATLAGATASAKGVSPRILPSPGRRSP